MSCAGGCRCGPCAGYGLRSGGRRPLPIAPPGQRRPRKPNGTLDIDANGHRFAWSTSGPVYLGKPPIIFAGDDDPCGPQFLPQFISPGDASAAVARVDAEATRLDQAIGIAGINMKDPSWWSQWFAWFQAWKAYEAEHRDWNVFDAPTVYTYCCHRTVELRDWFAQAEARGARVGVTPAKPQEGGGGIPTWGWVALGLGAAVVALGPGVLLAPLALFNRRK